MILGDKEHEHEHKIATEGLTNLPCYVCNQQCNGIISLQLKTVKNKHTSLVSLLMTMLPCSDFDNGA